VKGADFFVRKADEVIVRSIFLLGSAVILCFFETFEKRTGMFALVKAGVDRLLKRSNVEKKQCINAQKLLYYLDY
jgi:hypothetical protein